jgi:glucosamine--fructose-6-phosphate aminotransferase (isomerizing)
MSKQLYGTCCLLVEIAAFTSWTASGVGCKRTLRAFSQNGLRAEGYAAGELKHGPIALIDETMPVIVIAPYDRVFDKTVSNMQEVAARGGRLILVTDAEGASAAAGQPLGTLTLHAADDAGDCGPARLCGAGAAVQLIAYHTAVIMGTRNLAKMRLGGSKRPGSNDTNHQLKIS